MNPEDEIADDSKLERAMERRGFTVPAIDPKLGVQVVKLSSFKKVRRVGEKLTGKGALEVARGMFLLNLNATERVLSTLGDIAELVKGDPKGSLAVVKIAGQLLTHHADVAKKLADAGNEKPNQTMIGVSVGVGSSVPHPPARPDIGMAGGIKPKLGQSNEQSSPLPQVRHLTPAAN